MTLGHNKTPAGAGEIAGPRLRDESEAKLSHTGISPEDGPGEPSGLVALAGHKGTVAHVSALPDREGLPAYGAGRGFDSAVQGGQGLWRGARTIGVFPPNRFRNSCPLIRFIRLRLHFFFPPAFRSRRPLTSASSAGGGGRVQSRRSDNRRGKGGPVGMTDATELRQSERGRGNGAGKKSEKSKRHNRVRLGAFGGRGSLGACSRESHFTPTKRLGGGSESRSTGVLER